MMFDKRIIPDFLKKSESLYERTMCILTVDKRIIRMRQNGKRHTIPAKSAKQREPHKQKTGERKSYEHLPSLVVKNC